MVGLFPMTILWLVMLLVGVHQVATTLKSLASGNVILVEELELR